MFWRAMLGEHAFEFVCVYFCWGKVTRHRVRDGRSTITFPSLSISLQHPFRLVALSAAETMQHKDTQTLNYSWNQVFCAFWQRYPNPYSKHVLTEDVVDRSLDQDGRLFTKKLLSKTNSTPKWMERFLPTKLVYIVEESVVDLKAKTLTTYTRNIGLKHFMTVEEKVIYRPHENNLWTVSEKRVCVDSSFYGLSPAVKRFGLERYKQNIKKAYKGFNYTLEMIYGSHKAKNTPPFNLVLKQNIKDSATKASEFAKSKVPFVIAAADENQQ